MIADGRRISAVAREHTAGAGARGSAGRERAATRLHDDRSRTDRRRSVATTARKPQRTRLIVPIDANRPPSADALLYPPCEPVMTGTLPLDRRHVMAWEICGRRDGVPLVFLHGGPGGGSLPHHRRFYDPAFWKVVLYDQRGAGRSTPSAEIADNTTEHLVADLEHLREHLGIGRWLLFGGSWGSTLALAYAQAHPDSVLGLVLRGVFLASRSEIDWFMTGMRRVYPEAWRAFAGFLPEDERGALLPNYHRRLVDPDPAVHLPAARAWDAYESACSTLLPRHEGLVRHDDDRAALAIARIEAHYFMHAGFLREGQLLDGVARVRRLPCTIVQGRYDVICPPVTADALARAWPEAEYVVVPDAGHSVREPGITRALVQAVARMQARLSRVY
jgi:proline iminopeptidase